MLEMFDYGQRKQFFDMWSENFHETVHDDDITVEQLEFYLNVHFAIYARKHHIDVSWLFDVTTVLLILWN